MWLSKSTKLRCKIYDNVDPDRPPRWLGKKAREKTSQAFEAFCGERRSCDLNLRSTPRNGAGLVGQAQERGRGEGVGGSSSNGDGVPKWPCLDRPGPSASGVHRSVPGAGQPGHYARRRGDAEATWLRKQLCPCKINFFALDFARSDSFRVVRVSEADWLNSV